MTAALNALNAEPGALTPEAGAFFAFAISEQNVDFAKSSLASGAGKLGRSSRKIEYGNEMVMEQKLG